MQYYNILGVIGISNILKVNSLSASYKSSDFSLNKISFSVPRGSITGMIGENGAGKTTIINCVLGLKRKMAGSIQLFGREFDGEDVDIKNKIGVVFDDTYLPGLLTANEISRIYRRIYNNWDSYYFSENLERFNISLSKKIKDYSKGMQKMFSIVLALSHHPEFLILDEPTSSLDPVKRQELLGMFKDYIGEGEKSILFSSHITTDLEQVSDYVIFIKEGRNVFSAKTDILINEYGIVRCSEQQFNTIEQKHVIAYLTKGNQTIALINSKDRKQLSSLFMESPTLEKILSIFSEGVFM